MGSPDSEKVAMEVDDSAAAKKKAAEDKKKKKPKVDKDGVVEEELSAEDQALLENLELQVTRVGDADAEVQKLAISLLTSEIKSSTASMTSVPKPLKFLRPHYATLKATLAGAKANKAALADVLSVLAMTMAAEGSRESLKYRLLGAQGDIGLWGHEYVRALAGEVGVEYEVRAAAALAADDAEAAAAAAPTGDAVDNVDLMRLVDAIVPFHVQHNAEPEAVDLLLEVQQLRKLLELPASDLHSSNYSRICLYILRCADYMSDPDDLAEMLHCVYELYKRNGEYTDALRVALRIDDHDRIAALFAANADSAVAQQMGFILARHRSSFECEDDDEANEIIGNNKLSENFLALGRDLDVLDPKTPEDIYKSHLAETGGFRRHESSAANVDSAQANLASTFVNAFVNAGFGKDSLMTPTGAEWLYKNKDHGMLSAAASLGMIMLWDVESGLTEIDKFLYSSDTNIKAGAALAIGIVSSGVRHESDPPIALLPEHVESESHLMRCATIVSLGIAYAGAAREDVAELLTPIVANTEGADMTEVALAALSLGHLYVGTCDEEVGSVIVQRLMEASDAELDLPISRFLGLALGLLFLQKMERADAMIEAVKTVEHKASLSAAVLLETCAYAGTGNVLKIQAMLHSCAEHLQEEDGAEHQGCAVVGLALISAGEDIGSAMTLRSLDHLLHYGELPVRRAVPLALALLHVSNPDYGIIDQLSRLTHDADAQVAQAATIGLGIVGAGSNNSRIAGLLRTLAEHSREAGQLFVVRIAQGLLHAGKGLMTLSPFHSENTLMSGPAMAAVLTLLHCCLDLKNTLLPPSNLHFLLYFITGAMSPRMLLTVDEELNVLPVSVRVGQALETIGQAGKPKTITGFQTHTSPVLLGAGDRAELADDEYVGLSSLLSDVVMLRVNPDAEAKPADDKDKDKDKK